MNKTIKITLMYVALIAAGITAQSCSFDTKKTSETEEKGKEYTSKYVCPMHCKGSGSDTAGSCPVCKMDYEKNSNATKGKEHTSKYVCPMHCKGSGSDTAGSCPVCKMDYEKNTTHKHKH